MIRSRGGPGWGFAAPAGRSSGAPRAPLTPPTPDRALGVSFVYDIPPMRPPLLLQRLSRCAALISLPLLGCGGAPSGPPASADTVIRWAIGPQHLAPETPGADRLLLALSTKKPKERGTQVTPSCIKATSFLPAPMGDPRIFFLIGGQIHVRSAQNQAPVLLTGQDAALGVQRLIAADIAASPLQIVVSAKPHGASAEELWIVTVDQQSVQSQRAAAGLAGSSSKDEFFKKYAVPRCLSGGRRCLVVSSDENASYLDVEPTPGETPVSFQKLDDIRVITAAWASADGDSFYVLTPCS